MILRFMISILQCISLTINLSLSLLGQEKISSFEFCYYHARFEDQSGIIASNWITPKESKV
jgi:hypothetical protein